MEFSERLEKFGEETVYYCIRKEFFKKNNCEERHWSEKLVKELKVHKILLYKDGDLYNYNKSMAESIIEAVQNNKGDRRLKEIFLLQELYRRVPNEAGYNLDQTHIKAKQRKKHKQNFIMPENAIRVLANPDNEIEIEGKVFGMDELCEALFDALELGKPINYTGTKQTKSGFFMRAYDKVEECIQNRKEEVSKNMFDLNYNQLNEEQRKSVDGLCKSYLVNLK